MNLFRNETIRKDEEMANINKKWEKKISKVKSRVSKVIEGFKQDV